MVPPEETSAIVPGLEEGKDYEFRVVPVNAAGKGDASDPTASIFTKARKGLPCWLLAYFGLLRTVFYRYTMANRRFSEC